jgi:hypothetical protein
MATKIARAMRNFFVFRCRHAQKSPTAENLACARIQQSTISKENTWAGEFPCVRNSASVACFCPCFFSPPFSPLKAYICGFSPEYKKWLCEDVRWIIKDQERIEFLKLADDQRDQLENEPPDNQ